MCQFQNNKMVLIQKMVLKKNHFPHYMICHRTQHCAQVSVQKVLFQQCSKFVDEYLPLNKVKKGF